MLYSVFERKIHPHDLDFVDWTSYTSNQLNLVLNQSKHTRDEDQHQSKHDTALKEAFTINRQCSARTDPNIISRINKASLVFNMLKKIYSLSQSTHKKCIFPV